MHGSLWQATDWEALFYTNIIKIFEKHFIIYLYIGLIKLKTIISYIENEHKNWNRISNIEITQDYKD